MLNQYRPAVVVLWTTVAETWNWRYSLSAGYEYFSPEMAAVNTGAMRDAKSLLTSTGARLVVLNVPDFPAQGPAMANRPPHYNAQQAQVFGLSLRDVRSRNYPHSDAHHYRRRRTIRSRAG